jgi:hypothetical protein
MGEGKTGQEGMPTFSVPFLFYRYGCWIGRMFSKKGEEEAWFFSGWHPEKE